MSRGSLRRYDVQAAYACTLSLASIVPFAAAAIATLQRYNSNLGQIVYGSAGYFVPAVLACIMLSIVPGAIGCIDITTAASASAATLNNIGPGFARIGATHNYAWFTDPSKIVMSILMVLGRLEIFTILVLFTPRFWRGE